MLQYAEIYHDFDVDPGFGWHLGIAGAMDPLSVVIILTIGNFVAWIAAMYVKDALRGLLGHMIASMAGAFFGAYLALRVFPSFYAYGMIIGALIGAVLLLYFARFKKWRRNVPG